MLGRIGTDHLHLDHRYACALRDIALCGARAGEGIHAIRDDDSAEPQVICSDSTPRVTGLADGIANHRRRAKRLFDLVDTHMHCVECS